MPIVVETGLIVTGANSYLSVAEGDVLAVGHELETVWTVLTTPNKEKFLIRGTGALDLMFHRRWLGRRISRDQALDFPRWGLEIEGFYLDSGTIHSYVKKAAFEAALRSAQGDTLIPDTDPASNAGTLSMERIRVGPIEEELQYAGAVSRNKAYPIISMMLVDFIGGEGELERG